MTLERCERIKEVFQSAVDRTPHERAAHIDQARTATALLLVSLWAILPAGCRATAPVIVSLRDPKTHEPVAGILLQLYVRRSKYQSTADFWAERRTTGADGCARFERAEISEALWLDAWLPPDKRRVHLNPISHPQLEAWPDWAVRTCYHELPMFESLLLERTYGQSAFPYEVLVEEPQAEMPASTQGLPTPVAPPKPVSPP